MKPCTFSTHRRGKHAFTLVELLVVLSIIIIITSAVFVSFNYTGGTRGLDKGLGVLHSMTRIARAQAILSGSSSRMIIHFDPTEPEKFLRYIGVVVADDSDEACQDCWRAVDRGVYLPKDVYVVPRSSSIRFSSDWPAGNFDRKSIYRKRNNEPAETKGSSVFQYIYPVNYPVSDVSGTTDWIVIQFSPNGRLDQVVYGGGGLPPRSNQLVIAAGEFVGSEVIFSDSEAVRGLSFKVNGSSFTVPDISKL